MTRRGFLRLVSTGEGVVGLELGVRLGLDLGVIWERREEGEEVDDLEKKEVICRC